MNKIQVVNNKIESTIDIKDGKVIVENDVKLKVFVKNSDIKLEYIIKNVNVEIFELIEESNYDVKYEVTGNLLINRFLINSNVNKEVELVGFDSNIVCNHSIISEKDNNYILKINHDNKNTKATFINHGINIKNRLTFEINPIINEKSTNTISNQDSVIITLNNSDAKIKPNFIINNNDVIANHSSYIGKFKENEIFYLKSRGLNEKECIKLLAKGFLIGKMNLEYDEIEKILLIINSYWR